MTWLREIAVLTTTRAEFGLLRPLVEELRRTWPVHLLVGGTHLRAEFGATRWEIDEAGFPVAGFVDFLPPAGAQGFAAGTAAAAGRAVAEVGRLLVELEPDLLVLLGDRYETLAAALAALTCGVPVLHLHGGELTLGALDDAARHAVTKLAHLHGVAAEAYRQRVLQLGEEEWRVRRVGALGLAAMRRLPDVTSGEIRARIGLDPEGAFLIVGLHAETLGGTPPAALARAVREGLQGYPGRIVVTGTNADPGHEEIQAAWREWVAADRRCLYVESLGQMLLFALMRRAGALVGNTSCGILEAPSLGLPVVNLGGRQEGRIRGANVIDVASEPASVARGLAAALDPGFRERALRQGSPYGDGRAPERTAELLAGAARRPRVEVMRKRFADRPGWTEEERGG